MMCPHGQGGIVPVRTFCVQGGGQFFTILCGRPFWTAPYCRNIQKLNGTNIGTWPSVRLVVHRPGFDSLAESDQKTLKVGIHSFPT